MFLEFVSLGFVLTLSLSLGSASPLPQPAESQPKRSWQNSQNVQPKQAQLRSSFPNQGYYRPSSDDGFSDYEDPNVGFDSAFGNRPGFGGWNRPIRPRPGDRGFGAGSNSFDNDGNRLDSGADEQPGSGSNSAAGSQGNNGGNRVQPQTGAQSWTTVRTPVNRIFGEYTVPQLAQCIRNCPSVGNYDPICGSDNITYTNRAKFQCARQCGRAVTEAYPGSCATATVTA